MTFQQTRLQDEGWQLVHDVSTGYTIERIEVIVAMDGIKPVYEHVFGSHFEAAGYALMAAAAGDAVAIHAVDSMIPRDPPIAAHLIKEIKRADIHTIRLNFNNTRDASELEVQLCRLKDDAG